MREMAYQGDAYYAPVAAPVQGEYYPPQQPVPVDAGGQPVYAQPVAQGAPQGDWIPTEVWRSMSAEERRAVHESRGGFTAQAPGRIPEEEWRAMSSEERSAVIRARRGGGGGGGGGV